MAAGAWLACLLLQAPAEPAVPTAAAADPLEVQAIVAEMAAKDLWPGFDPLAVPAALYDGERTWLFRHPGQPEGFERAEQGKGALVFEGQHPAVRANSSAEIGGTICAAVLIDPSLTTREVAGVEVREAFRVFWGARHEDSLGRDPWLLLLPLRDTNYLIRRRVSEFTLHRALASLAEGDRDAARAWAWRAAFTEVGSVVSGGLERRIEFDDGLAWYVECEALGRNEGWTLPEHGYPVEDTWASALAVARAYAVLLDALLPGWKSAFGREDSSLSAVVFRRLGSSADRGVMRSPEEHEAIRERAKTESEEYRELRDASSANSFDPPAWTIRICAEATPLEVYRFNPSHRRSIASSYWVPARGLRLEESDESFIKPLDSLVILNGDTAQRAHFRGTLILMGSREGPIPTLVEEGSRIRLHTPGLLLDLPNARVERDGDTITITVLETS